MTNEVMERLVKSGDISSYMYQKVDDGGTADQTSKFRNTERLTIVFPSGASLKIDEICSGCSENVSLIFSQNS
jgi:hypothetical protein